MKSAPTLFSAILMFVITRAVGASLFSDTGHQPAPERFQNPALRSIGRLFFNGQTVCTATLIAPDSILTAAHCVEDKVGQALTSEFVFITGGGTEAIGERRPIDPGKITAGTANWETVAEGDIAIMKLASPLNSNIFPPASIAEISSSNPNEAKFLTGYFHRQGSILDNTPTTEQCETISPSAYARSNPEKTFQYNCGSTPGMSGSPYYALRNGRIVILGIHRGVPLSQTEDDVILNFDPKWAGKAATGYAILEVLAVFNRDHR